MKSITTITLMFLLAGPAAAQEKADASEGAFDRAAASVVVQLQQTTAELDALEKRIAAEQVPLDAKLGELEGDLVEARLAYQDASRTLDNRLLAVSNLRKEIKRRKEEATYLSTLLSEYINDFKSRLHIAEDQRYLDTVKRAELARDNSNLSRAEVYEAQVRLMDRSIDRLEDLLGGSSFAGEAVGESGAIKKGTFIVVGPRVLFRSDDGSVVGPVEKELNSTEPHVGSFAAADDGAAAAAMVEGGQGLFVFDPTGGGAQKIEKTEETLAEHIAKGGPVMKPILLMAGLALLVALYKAVFLLMQPSPSKKRFRALLDAVGKGDDAGAREAVKGIAGPTGAMLRVGVEHIGEPRELIEEVMYENVLSTRLKLQRMLPFISIAAASAPLMGLLGTVTGIINTFKLITVYGSGDVKTLSGGISEALITTEFGLIVAIPSLLIHAFLSRRARSVIDQMETSAVALVNQVAKRGEDAAA